MKIFGVTKEKFRKLIGEIIFECELHKLISIVLKYVTFEKSPQFYWSRKNHSNQGHLLEYLYFEFKVYISVCNYCCVTISYSQNVLKTLILFLHDLILRLRKIICCINCKY